MTCNSKCRGCGIWRLPLPAKKYASPRLLDKITTDPYLRANVESLNISGGEPFVHPDLSGFKRRMASEYPRLREICVNPDGHLIDTIEETLSAALPACAERGVKMRMYISLDGVGERHDRHRRHPGAFELADRALRHLAEAKRQRPETLRVTASFAITDRNADQIVPVLEYIRALDLRVDYNLAARPEVFIGGAGLERRFQVDTEQFELVRNGIRAVCEYPQHTKLSRAFYATMLETRQTGRR